MASGPSRTAIEFGEVLVLPHHVKVSWKRLLGWLHAPKFEEVAALQEIGSLKTVRSLLSMFMYYRDFIANSALLAAPLNYYKKQRGRRRTKLLPSGGKLKRWDSLCETVVD